MLPNNNSEKYPRRLSRLEKDYLSLLLPTDRPGYKDYRDKLDDLFIIGKGRFAQDDYVLGKHDDTPDFTVPAEPVLATGSILTASHKIDISIHEEFEEKIEIDFAVEGEDSFESKIKSYWTFSGWLPGDESPPDNSYVREIHLVKNKVVIALAPNSKRVWVHEASSGINHLIPQTNFYNEIMRVKGERDPKIALDVKRLFSDLDSLTDSEIAQGFLMYNKYLNKIKLDYSQFVVDNKTREKKSIFKIFGGKSN